MQLIRYDQNYLRVLSLCRVVILTLVRGQPQSLSVETFKFKFFFSRLVDNIVQVIDDDWIERLDIYYCKYNANTYI